MVNEKEKEKQPSLSYRRNSNRDEREENRERERNTDERYGTTTLGHITLLYLIRIDQFYIIYLLFEIA